MNDSTEASPSGSAQAWAKLADQFSSIAQQFREHYERVSASPHPEPEPTQGSVHRAVGVVSNAIDDTARTINEAVHDPQVRQNSGQAGSALLRAVGLTLTELGTALQHQADPPAAQTPVAASPSGIIHSADPGLASNADAVSDS